MKTFSFALLLVVTQAVPAASEPTRIGEAPYPPDSGTVAVDCGHLIDGIADAPIRDITVLIEDGRITRVGKALEVPENVPRMDLDAYTCLPGLIDMHTHIMETPDSTSDLSEIFEHTLDYVVATGIRMARITVNAGFTSVRNVGTYYGWAARELHERIESGQAIGPRLQFAGFYLSIPGGGGDLLVPDVEEEHIPKHLRLGVARGPEAFRDKARLAVEGGATVIKLIASGAVLAYGGVPGAPEMSLAEIAAAVEVAHDAGIPVTAHAHGAQSIKDAIRAGVDSIEHASLIDEEGIRLALARDVALSMDVYNGDWIAVEGARAGWPEEFLRKNDETTLIQRQNFRRAQQAGVTIVFGSDAAVYPHGLNARQFAYMVKWGMTPMEAIRAATSVAARVMGWADRVGAVRPGRFGDLIAVSGNPLENVHELESVDVVIKGGLVFKAPDEVLR